MKKLKAKRGEARQLGRLFTLNAEWIDSQDLEHCSVTGAGFNFDPTHPDYPSFDQKEPGQGYTPENTRLVAIWYNRAKGELTDSQIKQAILCAVPHL